MIAALVLSALLLQTPAPGLTVYVFATIDCPISSRYTPEIQRLAKKFTTTAKFVIVYPVPGDSEEKIAEHRKKFGSGLSFVRDTDLSLVKLTGVKVTPEVAVMKGSTLLYRGRIDDRFVDFGKERAAPTERNLEAALSAAIAGKPIPVAQTQAIGCIIADLVR